MSDESNALAVEKQAIHPIFKSLKLRRLKNGSNYKDGLRVTDKTNVGVIFPFERTHEGIADAVQTVLGFQYGMKISNYWIPRRFRIKENIFVRKFVRHDDRMALLTNKVLPYLKVKKSTFLRTISKNYLFDYSLILSKVFPPFTDHKLWSISRETNNAENFIVEWLTFILKDPFINGNVIKTDTFVVGGGVTTTHKKILMGIKVTVKDTAAYKYVDPSVIIPRTIKHMMDDLIPVYILRAIVAGETGYTEDKNLNDLYNLIKECSIVFYNNRGIGFIYNTCHDQYVQQYSGIKALPMLRSLIKTVISQNDPNEPELNIPDDVNEKELKSVDERFDSETDPSIDDDSSNDDVDGVIADKSPIEDPDFDEAVAAIMANKKVQKRVSTAIDVMKKAVKRINDDADMDDIVKDEQEINTSEEPTDDDIVLEDSEKEVEVPDSVDNVDEVPDDEETTKQKEIKQLISTISVNTKPTKTAAQLRRTKMIREKYKSIDIDGRNLEEILQDTKATIIKEVRPTVTLKDESLRGSRLVDVERSYIDSTMEHDVLNAVKCFSNSDKSIPIHIVSVEKIDNSDQLTHKNTYIFKLVDERDKRHTIKVDIPKIDEDGFMMIGGNKKLLKKQLTLLPVVKLKPDTVMISSNYNKCFIYRQGSVITRNVSTLSKLLNKELKNNSKFKVYYGDNSGENGSIITNIEYDVLSSTYHKFVIGVSKAFNSEYIFNQKELRAKIKDSGIKYIFKVENLPIGIDWKNQKVIEINLHDQSDSVCNHIFNDIRKYEIIKDFDNLISELGIAKRRMYTRIMLQSRDYALVAFLGGLYGLSKLINTEKIPVQFSEKKIPGDPRVSIKFKDGYLYYFDTNTAASLLLNGLAYMRSEDFNYGDFDSEKPYIDYFYEITKSRNVFKGHTAFKELFIDKITEEVLRDLGLPTEFLELFLYSNSLLSDNTFKSETDLSNYRIRGFENISVLLYKSIASQYRLYKQSSTGTGRLSIQQDQIFVALHKSFILENFDTTNPVNELKSKSIITFKGPGGINNNRVFTLEKRSYDKSAIGTIAISSVDNGSVGITKQLTLNPNITSTRGYINTCKSVADAKNLKLGEIASPEEADVAFVNFHDDPKRIGFTSGQTKHIIKIRGASPPVISTGMDKITPFIVGGTYVPKAKDDGVIMNIDHTHEIIIIKYKNGKTESIKFGEIVQRNSSFYFPNFIVPNVKEGQKVKKGDIVAYESDFYKKDVFGNIRSSQGVLAKLVLHEKSLTDDDSSVITESLSKKLTTSVVKRKQICLNRSTNIISFIKNGAHVLKGDPLLTFEDSGEEEVNKLLKTFGDTNTDVLEMSRQIGRAHV